MQREVIEVELTAEERALILRHGYPFQRIEAALKGVPTKALIARVPLDVFELQQLIGDLCRSINDMRRGTLQDKLVDLCDRLEAADRYGEGDFVEY